MRYPEDFVKEKLKIYCVFKYGTWWSKIFFMDKYSKRKYNEILSNVSCLDTILRIAENKETEWYECLSTKIKTKYFIKMSNIILKCKPIRISRKEK